MAAREPTSTSNRTSPDWDTYGPLIRELRLGKTTLKTIRKAMENVFGFIATEDQYRKKFEEMGNLRINLSAKARKIMMDILQDRADEGKRTAFTWDGKLVPPHKVTRDHKTVKVQHVRTQGQGGASAQIQFFTPPEESPLGQVADSYVLTDDGVGVYPPVLGDNIRSDGYGSVDTPEFILMPYAVVFLYPEGNGFEVHLNPAGTGGGTVAKVHWPAGTQSPTVIEITSGLTGSVQQQPYDFIG